MKGTTLDHGNEHRSRCSSLKAATTGSGRHANLVLATDLDGTFLGGSDSDKIELYDWVNAQRDRVLLVFVTGRALESTEELLADSTIPTPDYVIGDVGSSVAKSPELCRIPEVEEKVRRGWPGDRAVRKTFDSIVGLRPQSVPQSGRASYFLESNSAEHQSRNLARAMGLQVVVSKESEYLDILPGDGGKGNALLCLLSHLDETGQDILVCGDTLNDAALYSTGLSGVVVGGAERELIAATRAMSTVYHATRHGAGGIAEALTHFYGEKIQ